MLESSGKPGKRIETWGSRVSSILELTEVFKYWLHLIYQGDYMCKIICVLRHHGHHLQYSSAYVSIFTASEVHQSAKLWAESCPAVTKKAWTKRQNTTRQNLKVSNRCLWIYLVSKCFFPPLNPWFQSTWKRLLGWLRWEHHQQYKRTCLKSQFTVLGHNG